MDLVIALEPGRGARPQLRRALSSRPALRRWVSLWCRMLFVVAVIGPVPVGASAQEAPHVITVRPSGVIDEGSEARRRQEQLLRRLEQSEYQFRSICRVCGSPERFEVAAPFEPHRTLGGPSPRERPPTPPPPSETLLEPQ